MDLLLLVVPITINLSNMEALIEESVIIKKK